MHTGPVWGGEGGPRGECGRDCVVATREVDVVGVGE